MTIYFGYKPTGHKPDAYGLFCTSGFVSEFLINILDQSYAAARTEELPSGICAGTDFAVNIYSFDRTVSTSVRTSMGGAIIARAEPSHIAYCLGVAAGKAYISTWAAKGSGYWVLTVDPALAQDAWCHIVGVFDRTRNIGRIYVDGVHLAGAEITNRPQSSSVATKIGCRNDRYDQFFGGLIDDVVLFDKALSDQEVKQLYQKAVARHGYRAGPLFADPANGD